MQSLVVLRRPIHPLGLNYLGIRIPRFLILNASSRVSNASGYSLVHGKINVLFWWKIEDEIMRE